jgi:hypothetical protein
MLEAFQKDLAYGESHEEKVGEMFEKLWRTVERTDTTDILDFKLIDKKWREVWLELKTRRNKKDDYPDTLIWLNKLIEAYKRYDADWLYTLFLFKFTDWIYYVNPFYILPKFDYKMGRFDRMWFDKKKGYCYYNTKDLIALDEFKKEEDENTI